MNIVFIAGNANPGYQWGDWSVDGGIGGAEECLVMLTRELVQLGRTVSVWNHCGIHGESYNGVQYNEWQFFSEKAIADAQVVVSWRQAQLFNPTIKRPGQLYVQWSHDMSVYPHCPTVKEMQWIDLVVCLNEYHRHEYIAHGIPEAQCVNCGTAVDTSLFEQSVERIPGRCIAFFHPKRGLAELRRHWVKVKERVPWATLAQFWWEDEMFADYPPDERLGILPMRHLGPREIAAEILRSECFAYPATGTETAPLTVIKAQAGGAIPVVVPVGGIHETLAGQGVETSHAYFAGDLANLLADTMRQQILRGEMMAKTRQKYSWAEVAKRWTAELEKELKEHS